MTQYRESHNQRDFQYTFLVRGLFSLLHLVGRQATLELAKMMLAALALFPLLTSPTLAAIRNRMPDLCVTTTGDPCVFPFTYKVHIAIHGFQR